MSEPKEPTFHERLLSAQSEIGAVTKSATNPFFKSRYADINAYLELIKPILNEYGLVLLQTHFTNQFGDFIKTIISDGEKEITSETRVIVAKQNDPQSYGSSITYSRRYGIQSLLAIEATDDDAELAMNRKPETKQFHKPSGSSTPF